MRTADQLYWLGRYLERAENTMHAVSGIGHTALQPAAPAGGEWTNLLAMVGRRDDCLEKYDAPAVADIIHYIMFDPENPASLLSSLRLARENGRAVCGTISSGAWEQINALWLDVGALGGQHPAPEGIGPALARVREGMQLIRGAMYGTLVEDEAWRLIGLGVFLERADHIVRILQARYPSLPRESVPEQADYYSCVTALRSVGGVEAYRRVYQDVITPWRVIELLIWRREAHCSLRTCLDRLHGGLGAVEGARPEAIRLVDDLRRPLYDEQSRALIQEALHEFLIDFTEGLQELGAEIGRGFQVELCA